VKVEIPDVETESKRAQLSESGDVSKPPEQAEKSQMPVDTERQVSVATEILFRVQLGVNHDNAIYVARVWPYNARSGFGMI